MNLSTTNLNTHKILSQYLEIRYVLEIHDKLKKHEFLDFIENEDDCGEKKVTNLSHCKVSPSKPFSNCEIIVLYISNFSITIG